MPVPHGEACESFDREDRAAQRATRAGLSIRGGPRLALRPEDPFQCKPALRLIFVLTATALPFRRPGLKTLFPAAITA